MKTIPVLEVGESSLRPSELSNFWPKGRSRDFYPLNSKRQPVERKNTIDISSTPQHFSSTHFDSSNVIDLYNRVRIGVNLFKTRAFYAVGHEPFLKLGLNLGNRKEVWLSLYN